MKNNNNRKILEISNPEHTKCKVCGGYYEAVFAVDDEKMEEPILRCPLCSPNVYPILFQELEIFDVRPMKIESETQGNENKKAS